MAIITNGWSNFEVGAALQFRRYGRLQELLDSGVDVTLCRYTKYSQNMAWPPVITSALYYAVRELDPVLLRFLLKNGAVFEQSMNKGTNIILFYKKRSPEIFEILCDEAYRRIMNNTTRVYPEMVLGLVEYFAIKKEGFLYPELLDAAKARDTFCTGKLLNALKILDSRGDAAYEKTKS